MSVYWRMAGDEVNFVRVMSAVNPGHQRSLVLEMHSDCL